MVHYYIGKRKDLLMAIHPSDEEAFQTIDAAMLSGCPDEEFLTRLEYFMARWTNEIPMSRQINADVEADLADDEVVIVFGNGHTGELENVREYLDTIELSHDNWIKGIKGKFKFCAKVFSVGSDYGIKSGRISKLQICDIAQDHWGFEQTYFNYDRGWDVYPKDQETIDFLNGLLVAFGDDELTADDLLYYDLYGYDSDADFERGNRDHIGSFGCMDVALSEGMWYLQADCDEPLAAIKVISSDSETEQVQHRGRFPTDSSELIEQLNGQKD